MMKLIFLLLFLLLQVVSNSWVVMAASSEQGGGGIRGAISTRSSNSHHKDTKNPNHRTLETTTTTFQIPFMANALDYIDAHDTTTEHLGNCGLGPVDAKKMVNPHNPTCSAECYLIHTKPGEWVEYEFTSPYDHNVHVDMTFRLSSFGANKQVQVKLDGNDIGNPLVLPGKGWETFLDRAVTDVLVTPGGPHRLRVEFVTGSVNLCSLDVSLFQVPFQARALDYSHYKDNTEIHHGNCGTGPVDAKMVTPVDNPTCASDCYIAYTEPNEYVEYSFTSINDVLVDISAKVASVTPHRQFQMLLDGRPISDTLVAPAEGWTVFRDRFSKSGVYVRGGGAIHRLRILFVTGGINLCSVQVQVAGTIVPARHEDGMTYTTTTRLQAEDYQNYQEHSPEINYGGGCDRGNGVDMKPLNDVDSTRPKCSAGWTEAGEWLEYNLMVQQAQPYSFYAHLAALKENRLVKLLVDGEDVSGLIEAPAEGYDMYEDRRMVHDLFLTPGLHTVRFLFYTGRTNLDYIDIRSDARQPFTVAAFLPRRMNTCFVGDACQPGDDCVGLFDDSWNIVSPGFERDSFDSVKPENKYGDNSVCLELVLDDDKVEQLHESLNQFANDVYRDSNKEIELDVHVVELQDAVDVSLKRTYGDGTGFGFAMEPGDIRESAEAALDFIPDFGILIPPDRDPVRGLRHGIDWGGLAYNDGYDTIAGALCAWVPEMFAVDSGFPNHEWMHLLEYSYHQFSYVPTIYPNRYSLPACGTGHWDPQDWLPSPDDCAYDPDFISCGDTSCPDQDIWGIHILTEHFNPGVAYVPNKCKNYIQDYDETDVDVGGRCLELP